MNSEDVQSDDSQTLVTRRDALSMSASVGSAALLSNVSAERVLAQSGGPDDEISGVVEDGSGAVEGATVVAVPHDESLDPLVTTTDASGEYVFEQSDLHEDSNLYHVVARDGTETDPRRAQQQYPFIAAQGPVVIPDSGDHQWRIGEGSGSVLNDSIGSLSATINGATWESDTDSVEDYHLSLDGVDDYWVTDSAVDISQLTVWGWVRPQDYSDNDNQFISIGEDHIDSSTSADGFYIATESTEGDVRTLSSSGTGRASDFRNIQFVNSGDWGFFAFSWDGSEIRLITFDNSSELVDASTTPNHSPSGQELIYGGGNPDTAAHLLGDQDFYGGTFGGTLSKSQITELWEATKR